MATDSQLLESASGSMPDQSVLPTRRLYYEQPKLESCTATILEAGQDDVGFYLIFDQTIFHPQGGGQPKDEGCIEFKVHKLAVTDLKVFGPQVKHYVSQEAKANLQDGALVEQTIDLDHRNQCSRLHSMGHLISDVVCQKFPTLIATKGNHFPGGKAYVCFKGNPLPEKEAVKAFLEANINSFLKQDLKVIISPEKSGKAREMQIEGFTSMPCGGTHVDSYGEVSKCVIRNVKKEKGEYKIGYDVLA